MLDFSYTFFLILIISHLFSQGAHLIAAQKHLKLVAVVPDDVVHADKVLCCVFDPSQRGNLTLGQVEELIGADC